jgi:hypothetical protein
MTESPGWFNTWFFSLSVHFEHFFCIIFVLQPKQGWEIISFGGGCSMLFEADIFVGIWVSNRSRKSITLLSKNTSAGYPLKKYVPFWHVISAIAIKEYVPL